MHEIVNEGMENAYRSDSKGDESKSFVFGWWNVNRRNKEWLTVKNFFSKNYDISYQKLVSKMLVGAKSPQNLMGNSKGFKYSKDLSECEFST